MKLKEWLVLLLFFACLFTILALAALAAQCIFKGRDLQKQEFPMRYHETGLALPVLQNGGLV